MNKSKNNLRLMMANSKNQNALAPNYFNYYVSKGITVGGLYYMDELETWYLQSNFNKIISRLAPNYTYKAVNKNLLKTCSEFKPDFVWIIKGMEIYPATLEKLKNEGIKLINYNPDHPFRYISRGSGNQNILDSIPLYDLHFSYSQYIISELNEKYPSLKTHFLPFGFPKVENEIFDDIEEINKTCFIGFADKERALFIQSLLNQNISIDVYGQHWGKFLKASKNVQIFPSVQGNAYFQTIRKYRVQLNILRSHNYCSHNMRSFEVPAVGGILVAPRTPEHESFFLDRAEAFFFDTLTEASSIIKELLSLTESEALKFRTAAIERCKNSGYSYDHRAEEALNVISKL